MMMCRNCGNPLTISGRGPIPKFCSGRCRVAAYRAHYQTSIPAELRAHDRWVRWIPVKQSDRWTKVPLTIDGRAASSTDSATWSTYRDALASTAGIGLGFVLNGDGIVCIDLDHCVEDGQVNVEALRFLASLPRTYVEFSPSGDGLHVWGFGRVGPGTRRVIDGLHVETYSTGRYLTITGKPFVVAPFAHLT